MLHMRQPAGRLFGGHNQAETSTAILKARQVQEPAITLSVAIMHRIAA